MVLGTKGSYKLFLIMSTMLLVKKAKNPTSFKLTNKRICCVKIYPLYDETGLVKGTNLYYESRHVNMGIQGENCVFCYLGSHKYILL
jgi:hypothetical protein